MPSPGDGRAGVTSETLEAIRDQHGLGPEWEPRFTADTPVAERTAEDCEALGFEVRVFPHPADVTPGRMPGRGDRCVVYTRERNDDEGGLDDDLF